MHEIKINALQDAGCKHRSRQRPIVEVDQTRDSAGLSLGALTRTSTHWPPPSRKRDGQQGATKPFSIATKRAWNRHLLDLFSVK